MWSPGCLLPLWPLCLALRVTIRMFLSLERTVLVCPYLAAQFQTTDRTVEPKHSLHGAGHAVLTTLYSRAHRIGLDGTSYLLCSFRESLSLGLVLNLVLGVLA